MYTVNVISMKINIFNMNSVHHFTLKDQYLQPAKPKNRSNCG